MPPKAAIHLSNNYKVATQKDRAAEGSSGLLRTDVAGYSAGYTRQFLRDLAPLDENRLRLIREKMRRVLERPFETGEQKHGDFKNFMAVKFEGQSFVLLYLIDKDSRMVRFSRYGHHDVVYRSVPSVEVVQTIPFEQWVLQRR